MSDMRVALRMGSVGRCELRPVEVLDDWRNRRLGSRSCIPGTYTGLYRNGRLWMSDTTAEQADHREPLREIRRRGGRVLVAGLGIGMIVKAALAVPEVTHIDVVEIDPDVVDLIGGQYASDRCTVHTADIYEKKWAPGTRWDVAWFDIWPDLCEDNLTEMAKLARSYGRRVDWQGHWGRETLRYERRRTANAWWR